MASKYDRIKTAKDLIFEVLAHGLSLAQEDILRAQDIFGHSTIEELAFLANDIGRDNENGEPDPKGSCYSGRPGTRAIFYQILFNIWHWEEATRFWNQHSNPEREELLNLRTARKDWAEQYDKQGRLLKEEHDKRLEETSERLRQTERAERLDAELYDRELKIMELKAKLYDMGERVRELESELAGPKKDG